MTTTITITHKEVERPTARPVQAPISQENLLSILRILTKELEPCERMEIVVSLAVLTGETEQLYFGNNPNPVNRGLLFPMDGCRHCGRERNWHGASCGQKWGLEHEHLLDGHEEPSSDLRKARIYLRRIQRGLDSREASNV